MPSDIVEAASSGPPPQDPLRGLIFWLIDLFDRAVALATVPVACAALAFGAVLVVTPGMDTMPRYSLAVGAMMLAACIGRRLDDLIPSRPKRAPVKAGARVQPRLRFPEFAPADDDEAAAEDEAVQAEREQDRAKG
jgi:hypothetical protein